MSFGKSNVISDSPVRLVTDEFSLQGLPRGWPGRVRGGLFGFHHVEFVWYAKETHPVGQLGWDVESGPITEIEPISEQEYARLVSDLTDDPGGPGA